MNLNQSELFMPVVSNRLMALAKNYGFDSIDICAAWRGDDGDYQDSRNITLHRDAVLDSMRAFEKSIIESTDYAQPIKEKLLAQMDHAVKNLSVQISIEVHLGDSESEPGWF